MQSKTRMKMEDHHCNNGPEAPPAANFGKNAAAGFWRRCTALALALALAATLLAGCGGEESSSAVSSSTDISSSLPEEGGAEEETEFKPEQYVGTVLPKGEDAGLDYAKETLFLGDSNTERMLYYNDITGVSLENGFGVVSMGIQSFLTQGCARFQGEDGTLTMPEVAKLLQPRRIVITFGTNNVGMNLDRFTNHYKEALDALKKAAPYSDIIIGSIFPVDQYRENTSITMPLIGKMNDALASLAKNEGVKFLNWSEAMVDEETGFSRFESTVQDGVHLTREGMQAIFDYFRTHSYITEDTRPASLLKNKAKCIGTMPGLVTKDPAKQAGPIDWGKLREKEKNQPVTVTFSCWDETGGKAGGGSVSASSMQTTPGGTTGSVTASAASGYSFVGWSFASGTTGASGSATTSVTVDSAIQAGSTLNVTAVFRQTQAASGSQSESQSQSQSQSQPQSQSQSQSQSQPQVSESSSENQSQSPSQEQSASESQASTPSQSSSQSSEQEETSESQEPLPTEQAPVAPPAQDQT